jgi:hypothetical protein
MALASIFLAVYFRVSVAEWLFVFGAIGLVLTTELLNTALEELCNMLKDTHDPHVAKIKDLAAGAVLCASLCALAIGLIIFSRSSSRYDPYGSDLAFVSEPDRSSRPMSTAPLPSKDADASPLVGAAFALFGPAFRCMNLLDRFFGGAPC